MKRRNLLILAVMALCALLVFAGCKPEDAGQEQSELLLIAKEKTTQFQVVNYLEEDQKVREFLADLLIKTGAKYTLVEENAAGEHTIYIGTAAQFTEKGIAVGAMSYSNYSISVEKMLYCTKQAWRLLWTFYRFQKRIWMPGAGSSVTLSM